ncbi:hypothetical protein A4G19_01160 [Pasteurellaceae bacterium Macca]|nr:hypothetical protein [Pasteurellaceae bacterium Macca]
MIKTTALTVAALTLSACSSFLQPNVAGTYQGTLPCADCEKIEAKLVLNHDNTYQYNTVYFKNNKKFPFSETGRYTHDSAKGIIKLTNSNDLSLKVHGSYAELCDEQGHVPKSGNNYKLQKMLK